MHCQILHGAKRCFVLPGAHLQDVLLQGVGLSCASLSKPATDYLSALVDNAMVLGVRDTSLGRCAVVALFKPFFLSLFCCDYLLQISMWNFLCSFMPAVNNLTNELLEGEKSSRKLDRELRALRRRLGATLVLRGNLQE